MGPTDIKPIYDTRYKFMVSLGLLIIIFCMVSIHSIATSKIETTYQLKKYSSDIFDSSEKYVNFNRLWHEKNCSIDNPTVRCNELMEGIGSEWAQLAESDEEAGDFKRNLESIKDADKIIGPIRYLHISVGFLFVLLIYGFYLFIRGFREWGRKEK